MLCDQHANPQERHASLTPQHPSPSPSPGHRDAFSPPRRRSAARQRPNPREGHAASGRPGSPRRPLCQRSTPNEASQEPIHGASYLVSWPQPSAIPPRAYPQRLVPRAPRATALGRPRQEPIHSTSRIVPTGHSPSAVPPGAYPRGSCLVSQTTQPSAVPQEPIHSASCLVPQATTLCPHTDATCLHPSPTMAAGHHRTGLRLG